VNPHPKVVLSLQCNAAIKKQKNIKTSNSLWSEKQNKSILKNDKIIYQVIGKVNLNNKKTNQCLWSEKQKTPT
jgi:hypothetical protein